MASLSVTKVLILTVCIYEVSSQASLLDMILGNPPPNNNNNNANNRQLGRRRRPQPAMVDPFMAALGIGMGFDPFAMGGGGGMFGGGPAQPDPFARQSSITTAEEQMAETLTETGKTNPDRMRMERVINQVGGQFTGDLAALNYLVQDFWMTTPGPVPPPNRPPVKKGPGVGPARKATGGAKRQGTGMGGGAFQQRGAQLGQGFAGAGAPNPQMKMPAGMPQPGQFGKPGNVMGGAPMNGAQMVGPKMAGPPMAGPPMAGAPMTGAPMAGAPMAGAPVAGSPLAGAPGVGYKQPVGQPAVSPVGPGPQVGQASRGRPRPALPQTSLRSGPPPPHRRGKKPAGPKAGPPAGPQPRKASAGAPVGTGNPTRQQRIREKIAALRTKLNQLRTRTVNGKNPQLLGVQNQINGLVKLQKQAQAKPKRGRAQRPGKIAVITRPPPTPPRQGTITGQGTNTMPGQTAPTTAGYGTFGLLDPSMNANGPANSVGKVASGAPTHLVTMPKAPAAGAGGTTVAPQFGDVRYMNGHKYVYTDADGFDLPQWIKQAPGQGNNQNQAEGQNGNGQNGQNGQAEGQGGNAAA